MDNISLIIVEDHKIVRDGLKAMLLSVKNMMIEKEFEKGADFLEELKTIKPPATIILDIGLPDISGIEIAKTILLYSSDLKVVMLTANTDDLSVSQALKLGVKAYLAKDCSKDEFIEAVYAVNENKEYFSKTISQVLQSQIINSLRNENNMGKELSKRELEVIKYISEGLSYKEIGDKLSISARTVETHRYNILQKLDLKTNIDIVKYAIKNHISSL